MSSVSDKPIYAIFLDVDGVLLSSWIKNNVANRPSKEVKDKAFLHEEYLKRDTNRYSNNLWSIINAHYFSDDALTNLNNLIAKIEKVAKPVIIISSRWREDRTVDELKNIYFGMHSFAQKIEGKTMVTKYPDLKSRGYEINEYLKEHPEIKKFVVIDDIDDELTQLFAKQFIETHEDKLFTESDLRKACISLGIEEE